MSDGTGPVEPAVVAGRWQRGLASALAHAPRLHAFRPRLIDDLAGYDRQRFIADCGAGLTVGIVALPLAMAFAIASGVKPEQGIFTAIIAGFLISALGGSSVQIGGPAGAFIVIVYGIVQRYGVANLLIATVLAGVLLLALGWLRLGALVRYIPVSIVIGFTNGIAVLIAISQIKDLLGLRIDRVPADFFSQASAIATHLRDVNPYALGLGLASFLGLMFWARMAAFPHLPPTADLATEQPVARPSTQTRRLVRLATRIPGPIVALVSLTLARRLARAAGRDHRQPLRRHPARAAGVRLARLRLGQRPAAVRADGDDRAPRRGRVAAVRARRRRPDHRRAPRSEPGADGAGHRQHRDAVLRRHPGDRNDRAHRHQRSRRRAPARWPASSTR